MTEFPSQAARTAVAAALAEDESGRDVTTAWSVPEGLAAVAEIRARQGGIAGGLPWSPRSSPRPTPRSQWKRSSPTAPG